MTPAELRAHIIAPEAEHGHGQPADDGHGQGVDFADDAFVRSWHDREHQPVAGMRRMLGHVHDEFSSRREGGAPIVGSR